MSRKPKAPEGSHSPISREFRESLIAERGDWHGRRVMLLGNYYSAPLFAEMQKHYDLLRDEYGVLGNLYDYGPMTAQAVCALTGRPKNSVSRSVARLLAAGRISSHVNPNDRRESILKLEDSGRELYEHVLRIWRAREQEMFTDVLSEAELGQLDALLVKLLKHFHETSG
ncbi:MAG: MarR family winged helix-turn-helix transcriptional regulator [Caulobacteraceae bacterium]